MSSPKLIFPDGRRSSILIGGADSKVLNELSAEICLKSGKAYSLTDSQEFIDFATNRWRTHNPFHLIIVVDGFKDRLSEHEAQELRSNGYPLPILYLARNSEVIDQEDLPAFSDILVPTLDAEFFQTLLEWSNVADKIIERSRASLQSTAFINSGTDAIAELEIALASGDRGQIRDAYREVASMISLESRPAQFLLKRIHAAISVDYYREAKELLYQLK